MAFVCIAIHILNYLLIIVYNEIHEYGWLSYAMTFLLGVQDGALQTQVTLLCGFEFETNVEPFAIYRGISSFGMCVVIGAILS